MHQQQQQQQQQGLQGPRPATLKVSKRPRPPVQQQQQPVIIYLESPKVVHAHPGEFKSVVQRLTGRRAPPPTQLLDDLQFQLYGGQMMPLVASSSMSMPAGAADAVRGSSLGFFITDGHHQQQQNPYPLVLGGAAALYHQLLPSSSTIGACNDLGGGDISLRQPPAAMTNDDLVYAYYMHQRM
ncbi:hypothetical protein HU200_006857 [Digitaria exilis]|uniref:VQ domain-containing protein n=1 Tax=Digitaria exilis TaxID=1010633 RepID=A0A835KRV0_9POAL|nr:hypothetical protein HU200_006857 [Digitaria exilis]